MPAGLTSSWPSPGSVRTSADDSGGLRSAHRRSHRGRPGLFLQCIADCDLTLVELVAEDMPRAIEMVETYRDFPLGTTDASVIAIAERLNVTEVATLDHRHFPNVRPRHADYLTLLP